jgi:hypothetical protein
MNSFLFIKWNLFILSIIMQEMISIMHAMLLSVFPLFKFRFDAPLIHSMFLLILMLTLVGPSLLTLLHASVFFQYYSRADFIFRIV